ncbi:LppU/SCO3897 family protein [Actinomadura miaoliensis]
MPTMPSPGFPGQPPQPAPRKNGRLIALLAAGGVVAVVLLATVAVVVVRNASDEPSGPVAAEHCIDKRLDLSGKSSTLQTVPSALRVGCKSDEAKGRVTKVLRTGQGTFGGFNFSAEGCPDDSDGGARVRVSAKETQYWDVCVRNLKGPHPGDPGMGGGQLGPGDCISNSIAFNREVPCSSADWYGKVIARVATEAQCPAPRTMETAKFTSSSERRPVLCLGAGGAVLGPGDCIKDPTYSFRGPEKVECGGSEAVGKVTGRVRTQSECPAGSDKYMEAKEAYLPILCLKQLKPTLREQLGNLGRT